jgi:anti-sigma factor RsiW
MTPETARTLLHAYIDGELDPASTLEVTAQIERSPALRRELAQLTALQNALQNRATRYKPAPALVERIFGGDPAITEPKIQERLTSRWRALAIGSMVAAAALLFWSLRPFLDRDQSVVPFEEIVGAHVRSLMADHLTDLTSSERHTVKPWLSNRLDFAPPVLELAEEGYSLVGARLDYLGGKPAAAVVYRQRQHIINVFVRPSAAGDSKSIRASTHRGYNAVTLAGGGMSYWIISDLNPGDLHRLAELLQRRFAEGF